MNVTPFDVAAARASILARIAAAAKAACRDADAISLVAVSKVQSDERIEAAWQAGQRAFGENRVQEAQAHWQIRRGRPGLTLRLIGP